MSISRDQSVVQIDQVHTTYTGWAKKVSPKQFVFMMLITRHM